MAFNLEAGEDAFSFTVASSWCSNNGNKVAHKDFRKYYKLKAHLFLGVVFVVEGWALFFLQRI